VIPAKVIGIVASLALLGATDFKAGVAIWGVFTALIAGPSRTVRQRSSPERTHGRILAADFVAGSGAGLIGVALAGVLVSVSGVPASILGLGLAVTVGAWLLFLADRRAGADGDTTATDVSAEPSTVAEPNGTVGPRSSADVDDGLDLDGHVGRERADAHGKPGVAPGIAEHGDEQIGRAVGDRGVLGERRHRVDGGQDADELPDASQVAQLVQERGEEAHARQARRLVALLDGQLGAQLAHDEAVGTDRYVAGSDDLAPRAHGHHVGTEGGERRGHVDPQLGQPLGRRP